MTLNDVKTLINDEKRGEKVISWHSKYIWDALKNKVENQNDALILSKLMRNNLHYILILFSKISESGHNDFLKKYLHPEYSFIDYKFVDFNPIDSQIKINEKPLNSKNKQKNADRYIRIAFESLEYYKDVKNRNTKIWNSQIVDKLVNAFLPCLESNDNNFKEELLNEILNQLAKEALITFCTKSQQIH
jgi:hypothetical protein